VPGASAAVGALRATVTLPGSSIEWWQRKQPVWRRPRWHERRAGAWCNICHWTGSAFEGIEHVEFLVCPQCGSIARDRFLLWCFGTRTPSPRGLSVLETSPRLGPEYRELMRQLFDYRASDFDNSAHRADLQIDLQAIDLPDRSVDVVLTPHVLEHVPDPDRAAAELYRVVRPGGRVYLQVPLLEGTTRVPVEPEYHDDNTLVHWRFGWDVADLFRAAGFDVTALVTEPWRSTLAGGRAPATVDVEFDIPALVRDARPGELQAVATAAEARLLGWARGHQFATWECVRRH
jgi:SAM-dependent methyltransferase